MLPKRLVLSLLILPGILASQRIVVAQPPVHRIHQVGSQRTAAVVVQRSGLLHTTQLLPLDAHGRLVGPGRLEEQIDQLLDNLEALLAHFDSSTEKLVKMNVYVRDAAVWSAFTAKLTERVPSRVQPAVSFVLTKLPQGAVVGLDAIAATANDAPRVVRTRVADWGGGERFADVAVLPPGDAVYIAGQAERSESLAGATRATLAGLHRTLEHMGLELSDAVQVKCFMQPMDQVDVVQSEIAKFFGEEMIPPVAYVEWISSLPIEIELVAHAPAVAFKDSVSYLTPPWMTRSPVYSRVARIHGDTRIYVSGLVAGKTGDGGEQVRNIFSSLSEIVKLAGSDLRHLAKATYYVSDGDASAKLNEFRPNYYDPRRPPSASKAVVHGIGVANRGITIDMIAAPSGG